MNAQSVRSHVPLPRFPHPVIGWALFFLAAVVLYDSYDGKGRQGPWPASTIFPW